MTGLKDLWKDNCLRNPKPIVSSRILILNPVRSASLDQLSRDFFRAKASPGFEVECEILPDGPASVESPYDEAIAAAPVARRIASAADQGFSAAVINCFLHPGLQAAREVAAIPVVGAGESAIRMALAVGQRFSIIDVGPVKYASRSPPRQVRSMGIAARFASIRGIGVPVLELNERPDFTIKRIVREAKLAAVEDGADVIILGCTGLAGLAERIKLGIPIVDPALSALRTSETLILLGLTPGRRPQLRFRGDPRH